MHIIKLQYEREKRKEIQARERDRRALEGCTSLSAERKEALAMVMTGVAMLGLGGWFWWHAKN